MGLIEFADKDGVRWRVWHVDTPPSRAHLMDHVGDETLAGSRLALDEHRRQTLERDGRTRQQTTEFVTHGGQGRARAEQFLQHAIPRTRLCWS